MEMNKIIANLAMKQNKGNFKLQQIFVCAKINIMMMGTFNNANLVIIHGK